MYTNATLRPTLGPTESDLQNHLHRDRDPPTGPTPKWNPNEMKFKSVSGQSRLSIRSLPPSHKLGYEWTRVAQSANHNPRDITCWRAPPPPFFWLCDSGKKTPFYCELSLLAVWNNNNKQQTTKLQKCKSSSLHDVGRLCLVFVGFACGCVLGIPCYLCKLLSGDLANVQDNQRACTAWLCIGFWNRDLLWDF
jgi:hypothetical protein